MANEIKVSMPRHDRELLTAFCADFRFEGFGQTAAHADNIRLKEILKRRALFGKQTVVF